MANKSHVAILAMGLAHWNEWRRANPYISPDLSYLRLHPTEMQWSDDDGNAADLRGADLRYAQLSYGSFDGALLSGADLSGSQLVGARLSGADLHAADLSDSYCRGANFRDVRLEGCNLCGADLGYVFNLEIGQILQSYFDRSTVLPFSVEFSDDGTRITDKGVELQSIRGDQVDVMPGVPGPSQIS